MELFISYSRRDAKEIAIKLRDDLINHGYEVWWDQASMESRGRTFLQEIRDAIALSTRLLLLVTPEALESNYVTSEWKFALEACVVINPILISGEYDSIPAELTNLYVVDFRQQHSYQSSLKKLKRILDTPVPPLGILNGVDPLPRNHISSPDAISSIKALICRDLDEPSVITSATQALTLQGMGGIGKSVLAAEFARSCSTRRSFPDGVFWLKFGYNVNKTFSNLETLRNAFDKSRVIHSGLDDLVNHVTGLLKNRICLLILDDVWHLSEIEPFTKILGARTRLLITTRDESIGNALSAQKMNLEVFNENRSLQLLAKWSGHAVENLPSEAALVAKECGYLPLALGICGAMVHANTLWSDLVEALHEADLEYLSSKILHYPYLSVFKSIKVGIDLLLRDEPLAAELLVDLCVFRPDRPFPENAVLTMWQHHKKVRNREARKIINLLCSRSLVQTSESGLSFHDLTYDFIKGSANHYVALQENLLAAYSSKCEQGWHTGPCDGYFFENLIFHLAEAQQVKEVNKLLSDYYWLYLKLKATGPAALLEDFRWMESGLGFESIESAIKLSIHRLDDPDRLSGQLLGRLRGNSTDPVKSLLASVYKSKDRAWIEPLTPCLVDTASFLKMVAKVSEDAIESIAFSPDETVALISSGTSYETDPKPCLFFAVDIYSGEKLYFLEGHSREVHHVAISPNGDVAVSSSKDGTVRVWDLVSGETVRVLKGRSSESDKITTNGEYVIAESRDIKGGMDVWEISSGEILESPYSKYVDYGKAGIDIDVIGVSSAGKYAFALIREGTLIHWEIDQPSNSSAIYVGSAQAFDVKNDGTAAVTITDKGDLIVWNIENGEPLLLLEDDEEFSPNAYHFVKFLAEGYVVSLSGEFFGDLASTMKLWSLKEQAVIIREAPHTTLVTALEATGFSFKVATGDLEGEIKIWDLDPEQLPKIENSSMRYGEVRSLAIRSNQSDVVGLQIDGTINSFRIESAEHIGYLGQGSSDHDTLFTLKDGSLLTSSSEGSTLNVYRSNGDFISEYDIDVTAISLHPDNEHVWMTTRSQSLFKWRISDLLDNRADLPTPILEHRLDFPVEVISVMSLLDIFGAHYPREIAISPNGKEGIVTWGIESGAITTGGISYPISLIDLDSGDVKSTKPFRDQEVNNSIFCDDGEAVLSPTYKRVVKWSPQDGVEILSVSHLTDNIFFVALLPRRNTVLSASTEGEIRLWDYRSGQRIADFFLDHILTSATISTNGKFLVTSSRDGKIHSFRIWESTV